MRPHYPIRILILSFFLLPFISRAQNWNTLIQNHLEWLRDSLKFENTDITGWKLTDTYQHSGDEFRYFYIQQQYQNIPVYNAVSNGVLNNNQVLYFNNRFYAKLNSRIRNTQATVSAPQALSIVLQSLDLDTALVSPGEKKSDHQWVWNIPAISANEIVAEWMYQPVGEELRLCWNVSIELRNQPHWWNIRVDAVNGTILDQNDYTVSCMFEQPEPNPGAASLGSTPYYRVFPYPIESPNFGPRSLLSDPSNVVASPYEWHDVNGVAGEEYTYTRGNNVFAYEDANNDNLAGYSPDPGSTLIFDYPYTYGATAASNQDAAITNLFYACNTIHDYLYELGFNEVAGNFEVNNYGNGGSGSDAVRAEAQDGGGTNNANFSTPPDGNAGRMQMYLWNGNAFPCTSLNITSSSYNGSMTFGTATFSPAATVTAQLVLVNDGVGTLTDACSPIVNSVAGKIALIDRGGTCTYILKAQAAQAAGAVGVIIANNVSGSAPVMTGTGSVTIPCVSVSLANGNTLKAALGSGTVMASITTCTVNPIDACFDNGVISHEYGHGLSNRLTGGPNTTSCLTNAEQGGEGWSDWLALMMTMKAGDIGSTPRGIGTYSLGQSASGNGIRRYPYSTNMSINPQTYASLNGSTTVHQIGEIWCDALWDMSWLLIDNFGFNANPNVSTAGNNIAMKLVLEGMKLQPCNPGFIDARDAILTADAIFYANAHRCLLWQAFAGRGMGYGASQGSANSIADETVSFAMPPFCLPPTQIPVAAFTSDSTTILCGHKVKFTDQSIQAFSWLWDFGDQSSSTLQHPTHIFTSPGTYSVKLKVLNPLGADSVIHTIVVTAAFSATVSASPLSVCGGATVTLNANASGSTNRSYTVTSIPFAPFTGSFTNISLTDDQMSSSLPIGFTFNFYGTNYTNFYICSNGFITFSASMPASIVYGEYLPTSSIPNNLIALSWNDLNPQNAGSTIGYTTTGTAPNRKLIIQYNTSHYQSASMPFVVQAILYEGSNLIEIHTTSISNMSAIDFDAVTTQGVENVDGSKAVAVSGRNSSHFSATNDAYRFTPVIPYTYNWLPGNLPGANQNAQPLVNTTYTVQVSDGTACTVNYSTSPVVIVPCSTTISLHVLLQGYYAGAGEMRPVLLNQGVSTNNLLCDTITVELHSSSAPYNMLQTQKTVLQKNGTATVVWNVLPGPYYLVVKHRSSLETWSSVPVWLNSTGTLYDFTDAMTKAYGNNLADMGASLWAIYAGDIVKDENVDLLDYITIEADIVGFGSGYMATDINGDGNVDLLDIPVMEENINNFIYSNHP